MGLTSPWGGPQPMSHGTRVGEPALESPLSTGPRLLLPSFWNFLAGSGEATLHALGLKPRVLFVFFFFPPSQPRLSHSWCPREALPSRTTRKRSLLSGNASGEPNDDDSCQPRFRGADSRGGVWGRLARSKTRRTSELCSCHLSWRMWAGAAHGAALACVTSVTFEMYGGSDRLQDGGIS